MSYGSVIRIGSTSVLDPSEYQVDKMDLSSEDGTGRSESGLASKDVVARKYKITCKWQNLSTADLSEIMVACEATVFFSLTFFNPYSGTNSTITVYVGDRSAVLYNKTKGLWDSFSVNFIQK